MCTKFNLKIDESTELLDTKTFDDYDTNELLLLSEYSTYSEPHRPALRATYSII